MLWQDSSGRTMLGSLSVNPPPSETEVASAEANERERQESKSPSKRAPRQETDSEQRLEQISQNSERCLTEDATRIQLDAFEQLARCPQSNAQSSLPTRVLPQVIQPALLTVERLLQDVAERRKADAARTSAKEKIISTDPDAEHTTIHKPTTESREADTRSSTLSRQQPAKTSLPMVMMMMMLMTAATTTTRLLPACEQKHRKVKCRSQPGLSQKRRGLRLRRRSTKTFPREATRSDQLTSKLMNRATTG